MRIGELATATSTQVETIRFYEQEGLLAKPARSEGNFRIYGDQHLQRLLGRSGAPQSRRDQPAQVLDLVDQLQARLYGVRIQRCLHVAGGDVEVARLRPGARAQHEGAQRGHAPAGPAWNGIPGSGHGDALLRV